MSKYDGHCPLHQKELIFERHGVSLSCKTICDWMAQAAELSAPPFERFNVRVLESKMVKTDDRPVAAVHPD